MTAMQVVAIAAAYCAIEDEGRGFRPSRYSRNGNKSLRKGRKAEYQRCRNARRIKRRC